MEKFITEIEQKMANLLNSIQMQQLHNVLTNALQNININGCIESEDELEYCDMFIYAKKVEGCSPKSIKYYKSTIEKMVKVIEKPVKNITTEDIRKYLGDYNKNNNCGKVTIDNIRRIISSYFSWLEEENYILKSPVRRIHKIKTETIVKETYTDESIEIMRDNCTEIRDLAMIDLLNSTGMRVGELVKLNISDINFNERECIVFGKGINNSLPKIT